MTYSGFDLSGNVAFVTGASRGIGRAIALGLAECGADLFLCSRTLPDLQAVAREVRTRGPKAEVTAVDVGSVESIHGAPVEAVLVEERLEIRREAYLAVTADPSGNPSASKRGSSPPPAASRRRTADG
ncbi:MAG: SDR family NAD(P)-dependent oxidoreductase [candidate division NC10 bacterium]|nr:SDR family NAD(P)-dependent oxidoreductase [candidate division NC10 bacterium]